MQCTLVDRLAGPTSVSEAPSASTVRTTIIHRGDITFIRNFGPYLLNCTTFHFPDLTMQKEVLPKHRQTNYTASYLTHIVNTEATCSSKTWYLSDKSHCIISHALTLKKGAVGFPETSVSVILHTVPLHRFALLFGCDILFYPAFWRRHARIRVVETNPR